MRCQVVEVTLGIRNQGNALPIVINQPALICHARAGGHPAWVLPWSGDSKILDSRISREWQDSSALRNKLP
jgi:hypothetical protein